MNEYPKTDSEIRMWCLEYAMQIFGSNNINERIAEAQKVYDFICPLHKEEQPEQKKKSLARRFRSFLLKLQD